MIVLYTTLSIRISRLLQSENISIHPTRKYVPVSCTYLKQSKENLSLVHYVCSCLLQVDAAAAAGALLTYSCWWCQRCGQQTVKRSGCFSL